MGRQTTFKTQSPLMVVPVTVSSNRGERIWGLKESDFEIFDNGQTADSEVQTRLKFTTHREALQETFGGGPGAIFLKDSA